MHCEWVRNAVFAYLDGAGPAQERRAIQQHLASCAACWQRVETARHIDRRVRDAFCHEVAPAQLWGRIASAIAAVDQAEDWRSRLSRQLWPRLRQSWVAAVLVLVVLVVPFWWSAQHDTPVPVIIEPVRDFMAYQRVSPVLSSVPRRGQEQAPPVPLANLAQAGYRLVGSRSCAFLQRRLTALLYHNGTRSLSLYIMPGEGLTLPQHGWEMIAQRSVSSHRVQDHSNLIWREGELVYALVSDLPMAEIRRLF